MLDMYLSEHKLTLDSESMYKVLLQEEFVSLGKKQNFNHLFHHLIMLSIRSLFYLMAVVPWYLAFVLSKN